MCMVWCMGRTMAEVSRIWRGAWRGPGRLVVPPSQGMPKMPMSMTFRLIERHMRQAHEGGDAAEARRDESRERAVEVGHDVLSS